MKTNPIIAGIGETPLGKLHDYSCMGLHALAADLAIKDAGMEWGAIDGLLTCGSMIENYPRHALAVAEYLGICEQLKYLNTFGLSGATPFASLVEAWRLVKDGICNSVLVIAADKPRTGQSRNKSVSAFASMRHPDYEQPYGLTNATSYAMLAQYHMDKYKTTPEQFAAVSVTFREYAMNNPQAVYRDALTIEDVIQSRIISTPLHLYECSPITDGGGAFLVTREELCSSKRTVSLQGFGYGFTHDHVTQLSNLAETGCKLSAKRAFEMAGIKTNQIDVAEIYDSYTITLLLALENLGICEPGTSGSFVESGALRLDGSLPTNTHGGLLSHSHCGAAAGIFHITEAIKQLRGQSANQVKNAKTALLHGEGGILSANCTLLLTGN
jgi:acetyl-CoA acetyltransferase